MSTCVVHANNHKCAVIINFQKQRELTTSPFHERTRFVLLNNHQMAVHAVFYRLPQSYY